MSSHDSKLDDDVQDSKVDGVVPHTHTRTDTATNDAAVAIPAWLLSADAPVDATCGTTAPTAARPADTSLASRSAGALAPSHTHTQSHTHTSAHTLTQAPTVAVGGAAPAAPQIIAPSAGKGKDILDGFRIVSMRIRGSGFNLPPEAPRNPLTAILWQITDWNLGSAKEQQLEAHLPAALLSAPAVAREITFSSERAITHLCMRQRVFLSGQCIETFDFDFGFVIPKSTNSWETIIEADEGGTLPAEVLSGNLTVETAFYDDETLISQTTVRVFYDA